jgi:hypothetical protein
VWRNDTAKGADVVLAGLEALNTHCWWRFWFLVFAGLHLGSCWRVSFFWLCVKQQHSICCLPPSDGLHTAYVHGLLMCNQEGDDGRLVFARCLLEGPGVLFNYVQDHHITAHMHFHGFSPYVNTAGPSGALTRGGGS